MEDDGYQVTEIRSSSHILLAVIGSSRRGREVEPGGVAAGVPQRAPYDVLPALPALAPLLPGGGLAKGSVLAVESAGALCLALIAGPSQAGCPAPDGKITAAARTADSRNWGAGEGGWRRTGSG